MVGVCKVATKIVADEVVVHLIGIFLLGEYIVLELNEERTAGEVVAVELLVVYFVARTVGVLKSVGT